MSTLLSERRQPIAAPTLLDRVPAPRSTPLISARHEPAAASPFQPAVTPRASWSVTLGSIIATLREWRRRRIERRALASFDARTLRDLGLDPGAVDYEMSQWFWRSPRDWRG